MKSVCLYLMRNATSLFCLSASNSSWLKSRDPLDRKITGPKHMPKFSTVILFDSSHAETLKYNDKIFMFFYYFKLFIKLHRNSLPRCAIRNSRVEKWAGCSRLSAKWIIPRVIFKSDSAEEKKYFPSFVII